jgi:putative ABC transport system permease protein
MLDWKPEIRRRLAGLQLAPVRETAIVEELAQYLEDCYAELRSSGATDAEAYQRTLAELSGGELLACELRRVERQVPPEPIVLGTNRRTNMIADLGQDLRYGARMLRRNPGFTGTVLLTLALGLGATTTVFTFVDALLLRPLPVMAPEQLHALGAPGRDLNLNPSYFSYPFYRRLREASPEFSGLIALMPTVSANANFGAGDTERVRAEVVSGNYFTVLGVPPAVGRMLTLEDDVTPGAHPFVVLSHDYWQRRFAGAGDVVGQKVSLNGHSFTVVGMATRPNLTTTLKGDATAPPTGHRKFFLHDSLTVAQVSLSLLLLIGAGLIARTLANLQAVDLGYQREHIGCSFGLM